MIRKTLTAALAMALVAGVAVVPQAASAAMHKKMHAHRKMMKAPKLRPAMEKPGFQHVTVAPQSMMLVDTTATRVQQFKGVPILGDLGL